MYARLYTKKILLKHWGWGWSIGASSTEMVDTQIFTSDRNRLVALINTYTMQKERRETAR